MQIIVVKAWQWTAKFVFCNQQNWLEALNSEVTRVTMEEAKRKKIQLKPFSPISTPKNNTLRHSALSSLKSIFRSEIRKWRNLAPTMPNSGELVKLQLKAPNRRSSFPSELSRLTVPGEKLLSLVVKWPNLGFSLFLVCAITLSFSAFFTQCHAKMNRNVAFVNFGVRLMELVR